MPKSHELLPAAQDDLEEIISYIFEDNPRAAYTTRQRFEEAFEKLALNPYMGHKRGNITSLPVRFWNVFSYQIIYKPDSDPLEILRILSGYRDLDMMLND